MKQRRLGSIISAIMTKISLAKPEELAKYNVNTLARLHGISAPNLSRAFQTRYPLTLGQYLQYLKVHAFEKLIKENPGMTVRTALKILDIRSESHFGELYKKRRNITPGDMAVICKIEQKQAKRPSS
ncbi:MAG TPA: helix-turn-helix domain-containing protein [Candidatus Deferrimicrobium sp.]|nr:helix-turn-helix domain-containing protein [Candidatus Kapabacteria bacterium]HLP57638.1 helix-turn-helix domain-containing protein [Candidatus Deferrimicrobium sp.]